MMRIEDELIDGRLAAAAELLAQDEEMARRRVWQRIEAEATPHAMRLRGLLWASGAAAALIAAVGLAITAFPARSDSPVGTTRSVSIEQVMEMLGGDKDADAGEFVLQLVTEAQGEPQ